MPHTNRVIPFNELIATPARGTLMGNRGAPASEGVDFIEAALEEYRGIEETLGAD